MEIQAQAFFPQESMVMRTGMCSPCLCPIQDLSLGFGACEHAEPASTDRLDLVLQGVQDKMLVEPPDVTAHVHEELECPPILIPKLKNPLAGITQCFQSASTLTVSGLTWTPPIHSTVSTTSITAVTASPMMMTQASFINNVPVR
ncbi:hypothetical protein BYT27DRAFT_7258028 [Phlegmacium glaucopus]|nr:hypothetical protein BYT27DRAFT_7258028 [Phlegmacium glaucopus]